MSKRLHYVDWLRVLAVLLLFPFHTSRVFNFGEPFYIKSQYTSQALNYFLAFVDRWQMPLLFLLAGASTYLALSKRTTGQYVTERVKRLLVPLVFGIFVIMPPQTWVGAQYNSGYTGSFWQYISSGAFLKWNIQEAGDYYGGFGIGHLWFILFLFLISLIALPIVVWGRRERGNQRVQSWSRALSKPAWWLLPPLVLWLAAGLPEIAGKNLVLDLVYFLFGYIVIASDTFSESAERYRIAAVVLGIGLTVAYITTWRYRDTLPDPSFSRFLNDYGAMIGTWTLMIGMMGFGKRYLDQPSRSLAYLAEGSYPIYILHQTVIVLAAFWLVRMPAGIVAQWLAVFVVAVAATFALYEGVRRMPALRFVFGMRPQAVVAAPATAAVASPEVLDEQT